ncbi:hypothetical protein MW887_001119 [Aspergillus wentii]|nr:hypothetical protein MW887_001119 [Aspergillus wentii]
MNTVSTMVRSSIFVGVDFGTTYRTSLKVPTVISYDDKNILWGYQVGPFKEALRGIKLLLDDDQQTKYKPSVASKTLLAKYDMDVVQVTGDYLRQIIKYVKITIERRLGSKAEDMDLRFILTVPAVWSDTAKHRTMTVAIKAGVPLEDVSLISEPEAAALYSLRSIQDHSVTEGNVYIVCDAGGGTVDLISYLVKDTEPLSLVEVTEGTDQTFQEFFEDEMGQGRYAELSVKSKEAVISYWRDRVKPYFTGKVDDDFAEVDYFIPVPGVTDDIPGVIEDGFFTLSREEVEDIFDLVVDDIQELAAQQVKQVEELGYSTEVEQPPYLERWSAVVTGAVQRGIDGNQVESRISRRHYGIRYSAHYDSNQHEGEKKRWSWLQEKYLVDGQMQWYINKSSKIKENKPISIKFYRITMVKDTDDLMFETELHFCNDEKAPSATNDRIMKLCTLESDLSKIPRELFTKKKNSMGIEYYEIVFDLVMTPTSASLQFQLEFQGVPYGTVSSKY